MKILLYFHYVTRSLWRGGQRTLLAIFCVAVGVMAIVALQLVGLMINGAFMANVRDANGGDIAVSAENQPFTPDDLDYFDQLQTDGTISNYTAVIDTQGWTGKTSAQRQSFSVRVIDPANYPLLAPPTFASPKNGRIGNLVKDQQIVVTKSFADQYKVKLGDHLAIHLGSRKQNSFIIHVKLDGILAESGVVAEAGSVALLSINDYEAALPKDQKASYTTVDITTDSAHLNQAVKDIRDQFPIAKIQTAADALKSQQESITNIKYFLEIAGLLALLIGGVGIVNTMQVLLSRRKIEIAMLKTTGYRRFDLYLLFGLEAGLLGLIGGAIGSGSAIGISYLIRHVIETSFGLQLPFILNKSIIAGGIAIGLATTLIFGLLPIVQAANIRPLNVIRESSERRGIGSMLLTFFLLILLTILFCLLAIVILNNNIQLGIITVYSVFLFLALLSIFFSIVIFLISKLPVSEHFSIGHLLLVMIMAAISALTWRVLPAFGMLLAVMPFLGIIVMIVPRTWKTNTKMALRNLNRQRARTTTTLLALFVGVFAISLILILGQNLHDEVNRVMASALTFNIFTITSNEDTLKLQSKIKAVPGLSAYQQHALVQTVPTEINGKPIQDLLPNDNNVSPGSLGRNGALYFLGGIEGYDVAKKQLPIGNSISIIQGRNLQPNDADKDSILIANQLADMDPLHLKIGDTVTLRSTDHIREKDVHIVGIYRILGFGGDLYPLLSTNEIVKDLSAKGSNQAVFYMKISPDKLSKAVDMLGQTVPNAFTLNLANIGDFINQLLDDILLTLTTIASLSLLASIIIIANAVALAMLERRRELGILKSVGYTSRTILGEVLLENGLVGGTGAMMAMLLVSLVIFILGKFVFHTEDFAVAPATALLLVLGAILLAMLTAALVAWQAVRVRPLDVLRYE